MVYIYIHAHAQTHTHKRTHTQSRPFYSVFVLNLEVEDKDRAEKHGCERFGEDARSHPLLYSIRCVRILIRVYQNLAHPVRSHSHPGSHPYPWFGQKRAQLEFRSAELVQ